MSGSARIDELQKKFNENPRRYFAPLADEYRKAGDIAAAIEMCRAHLAQQPGHMSGHIVLGKALYENGALGEAQEVFQTALGLDPENLIALRHLGDIARQQGEAATARSWYQRVLDADPRNEEIASMLRVLDEEGSATSPAADVPVPPVIAEAPDTLAESTVPDGSLPPALEPSAIAYLAEEPTLEMPAFLPSEPEPVDLEIPALDFIGKPPRPAPPTVASDIGLESMEFVAPGAEERGTRAEGLERPEYDFDPHVVDGEVRAADANAPAAFVTETMAELYLQQGFHDEALGVYRQLLEQNPADDNLRARVQQLEGGRRSTLAFEVSEDVVRAAQERQARATRRTARRFFASLAGRRAPIREMGAAGAAPAMTEPYGDAGADTSSMDAARLAPEAEATAYDAAAAAPEAQPETQPEAQAWEDAAAYGASPAYEAPPADAEPEFGAWEVPAAPEAPAAEDAAPSADWDVDAAPREDAYGSSSGEWGGEEYRTPPRGTNEYDVSAYEWETAAAEPSAPAAPASPTPDASSIFDTPRAAPPASRVGTPTGGAPGVGGTVDALFGGAAASADDEAAAAQLAGVFGGTAPQPAVRPATGELSLDHVFRETPRRSESQKRESSAFSFDQFFSDDQGGSANAPGGATPATPPPGAPGENGDIEQFNAWLDGLKKK